MNDGFYDVFKEKQLEEQVQRMLKSRRYSRGEIAWITNTTPEFVEEVNTRTYAEWIVRLFNKLINWFVWIVVIGGIFTILLWGIANNNS